MVRKVSKRGLWMLGTIVWDKYASGTYGKLPPHYKEYNDIDDIIGAYSWDSVARGHAELFTTAK